MSTLRLAIRPSRMVVKAASRIAMSVRQRNMAIRVFPLDEPGGRIEGKPVDRIVVLGDWLAIGWGVATYGLSLGGCFARGHALRAGRGVEWSAVAVPGFRMAGVPRTVSESRDAVDGADIAVLALGAVDTMAFTSARTWRRHLTSAIDALLAGMRDDAVIVLAAIPPLDNLGTVSRFVAKELGLQVRMLNGITAEVAAGHPRCIMVDFPPALAEKPWEAESKDLSFSRIYMVWSAEMVSALARERELPEAFPRLSGR